MKAGLELDLRWGALFLSLLMTAIFWHVTWVMILNTVVFAGLAVAYMTVIQRYLDRKQAAFQSQLMDALQRTDRAELAGLISGQWVLGSLGRRYALDGARGMVELLSQHYAEAYGHFTRALRSAPYPHRSTIEINLINTEIALGLKEEAIERCRHVLRYRPNSPMIREKLAQLMLDDLGLEGSDSQGGVSADQETSKPVH